ncbi:hypothetical protein SLEP1_g39463 [Rubroshorea leprosula]|uniref:Uncharacterized protein n=1 Tax=Rubroshorea leprosula TaxID=152421 RepID=A0AAV5L0P0_9ROSI|nr:hypothetical protein SLEP1_g39463 [Rubroshorea leprosula]
MIFAFLFLFKNQIWSLETSPPAENFRICFALFFTAGCSCFVGANCFGFW